MVNKEELDKFANESIPLLMKNGYLNEEKDDNTNLIIFTITLILCVSIFSGVFYYIGYKGYLKSSINQDVILEPQINITSQTDNQYSFNPNTDVKNDYKNNFTIIINNYRNCTE